MSTTIKREWQATTAKGMADVTWTVRAEDRGQMIEVAYGVDEDGCDVKRVTDMSAATGSPDRVSYYRAQA